MINSLLDSDLYKFTMQNAVCTLYPKNKVRYSFINRGNTEFPPDFGLELRKIINDFKRLTLSKDEKEFLEKKCYYLNPVYLDFLNGYQFDPNEVEIIQIEDDLQINVEGYFYKTILWEVPLMAVISQLYFEMTGKTKMIRKERKERNRIKFMALKEIGVSIAEFGTRRRYSLENQDEVIRDAKQYLGNHFVGSSNVYIAMKHNLNPIGTKAHEFYQFHAAKYGFRMANEMASKVWTDVYQGNLGIALPDTFTTDVFLRTFDSFYARLYDGLRHDSSSPFDFITKTVNKYKELKIDPITKTIVFSDSINSIDKVKDIHRACSKLIRDSYGIGTWFTNDIGVKPLNIVIKMVACMINGQWIDTIKLSDDEGKNTGKEEMIAHCKKDLMI